MRVPSDLSPRRAPLSKQQLSGSLNSEGDRYSYAQSQGSDGGSGGSQEDADEGDPQKEPLVDCPYYRKLQDLNRCATPGAAPAVPPSRRACRRRLSSLAEKSCIAGPTTTETRSQFIK